MLGSEKLDKNKVAQSFQWESKEGASIWSGTANEHSSEVLGHAVVNSHQKSGGNFKYEIMNYKPRFWESGWKSL